MKNTICVLLALAIAAVPLSAERFNFQFSVTAGTPQRISTNVLPFFVDRLMIQSRHNNTGTIYIMLGVPLATTCNAAATSPYQLSAELGPGDATHPGAAFSDPQGATGNAPSEAEDLTLACIDGTVSGDKVVITGWHRN